MVLQPSLIVLVGPETARLGERLPLWLTGVPVTCSETSPLPIRTVANAAEAKAKLEPAVRHLRSAALLQQLSIAGIAPQGGSIFRSLLVLDYQKRGEAAEVIAAINGILDSLAFAENPSRQFWLIVMGPSTLDEARAFRQTIMVGQSNGESRVAFSVMPSWRDTIPSQEDLLTATERLAMLLALTDSDHESPFMQLLNMVPNTAFVVGLEPYCLSGLDRAVENALRDAVATYVEGALSGSAPDHGSLVRLVYSSCPRYDLDSKIVPGTPEAESRRREYLQKEVPSLLSALARHASNLSDWEQLIQTIRARVAPVSRQTAAKVSALMLIGLPQYIAVGMALAALVAWLLLRKAKGPSPSGDPPGPEWMPNAVLYEALTSVLEDMEPLLRSSHTRDRGYQAPLGHAIVLGEEVEVADSRKEDVRRAAREVLDSHLPLFTLLSIGWLQGANAPIAFLPAAVEAGKICRENIRRKLLDLWVESCRKKHVEAGERGLSFLFSPARPDKNEKQFLLARKSLFQRSSDGLYPEDYLHHLYLVNY